MTVVWNGTLDRKGLCPHTSSYLGNSPLCRVIERQDMTGPEDHGQRGKCRGRDRHERGLHDDAIRRGLAKGCSYRAIARQFNLSLSVVRRVAQDVARG